jgi:hypothetical protein
MGGPQDTGLIAIGALIAIGFLALLAWRSRDSFIDRIRVKPWNWSLPRRDEPPEGEEDERLR